MWNVLEKLTIATPKELIDCHNVESTAARRVCVRAARDARARAAAAAAAAAARRPSHHITRARRGGGGLGGRCHRPHSELAAHM
jgi:hypothetical protein